MDVKHLNYILMISQEKNISKAAAKLYMSQSSLSYVVSSLERELGTPLFLRQKNGIELTEAGEKYVEAAEKVVQIRNELYEEIAGLKAKTTISVAATSLWGTRLFADAIPKFRKKYPQVNFKLSQVELFYLAEELRHGGVDFAFASTSPFVKLKANMYLLKREEMFLAVPKNHSFKPKKGSDIIPLSELSKHFQNDNFLTSRPESANRIVVEDVFRQLDFHPHITEINGLPMTCDMIAAGLGISLMPESGILLRPKEIRFYHLDPMPYRYNILITKPKSNFSEMDKFFFEFACHLLQ